VGNWSTPNEALLGDKMIHARCPQLVMALMTLLVPVHLHAQPDDKNDVEATIRGYEQAVQDFDFEKANSLLAPDAVWIEEDSIPAPANQWPEWWQKAKAARLRITNQPHDFDIRIHGDVAHVVLLVDTKTMVDNETAHAFTMRTHPNEREWQVTAVESEVLIKTPSGWRIALGHTSLLPQRQRDENNVSEGEVLKVSQLRRDALNHRDADTFSRYTDNNYIGTADDGVVLTKSATIQRFQRTPWLEEADDRKAVRVQIEGDAAVINYQFTLSESFPQMKRVTHIVRTEFFKKSDGKWLAIAVHDAALPVNFRKPLKVDPKLFKDYVGQYDFAPGLPDTYTVEGDHLMEEWKKTKQEAFPLGQGSFFVRDDLGWVTFVRDDRGQVTGYVYHFPDGQELPVNKIK
jgi:ketosteroid isomerase-like protein